MAFPGPKGRVGHPDPTHFIPTEPVAEEQFRRIIGYRDLAKLIVAVERHASPLAPKNLDRQEIAEPVTV